MCLMDAKTQRYSHNCAVFCSTVGFSTRTSLPGVPVSAITQDLRATWASARSSARSSGDRRRPTKCLLTWLLDSLESLGAPGTTLAYCRVKYSTFLISHSAPLYLRQNYADWYIRESYIEGYRGMVCLKPAADDGYRGLDFLIAAVFVGCFSLSPAFYTI